MMYKGKLKDIIEKLQAEYDLECEASITTALTGAFREPFKKMGSYATGSFAFPQEYFNNAEELRNTNLFCISIKRK